MRKSRVFGNSLCARGRVCQHGAQEKSKHKDLHCGDLVIFVFREKASRLYFGYSFLIIFVTVDEVGDIGRRIV